MKYLNELEIVQYCKDNNIDPSICYCKECGKFLAYDNAVFHLHAYTGKLICDDNKLSFLSTRNYNGNVYHLCRCYDCVCKKFPNFRDVRFKFAHKAAKYTLYGFDVPDEDFKPVSKARQCVTKEKMIKRYGKELGLEKWNSYCKKQSITNTYEYKRKKYGMTSDEFDEYNKSRAITKENLIKKHGEKEGLKIWDTYIERQRYTCTLEYFIEEYGEKEGKQKYNEFVEKRSEQYQLIGNKSNISKDLFSLLKEHYKDNDIYVEYSIKTKNNKCYYTDYYDKTLNIVIEFYGDFYHFNPKKYSGDETDYFILKNNESVKDRWKHDKERIDDIQQTLNCKIIIVWESTYRNDKKGTINSLILMINSKEQLNNITEI